MISKALAIGIALATVMSAAASATRAADLYDNPPRIGSPYDDPRYRDMYGYQPAPPPRYVDRGDLPPPRIIYPEVPRDHRGYLAPMPAPGFVDGRTWAPDRSYRADDCIPREAIRRALQDDGWHGFHDLDLRGPVAVVFAYRPDGRLYRVKVDRCNGAVIASRLVDRRDHAEATEDDRTDVEPRRSRWDGPRQWRDDRTYRY
ncbi:MAG: hypothetical protein ACOYLQ_05505 [Hyphomicrobiaceae bacterium]